MAALDAIETDSRVRVLVTCVEFRPGKPHGVALARMVRIKRPGTRWYLSPARNMNPTPRASVFSCQCRSILTFW